MVASRSLPSSTRRTRSSGATRARDAVGGRHASEHLAEADVFLDVAPDWRAGQPDVDTSQPFGAVNADAERQLNDVKGRWHLGAVCEFHVEENVAVERRTQVASDFALVVAMANKKPNVPLATVREHVDVSIEKCAGVFGLGRLLNGTALQNCARRARRARGLHSAGHPSTSRAW